MKSDIINLNLKKLMITSLNNKKIVQEIKNKGFWFLFVDTNFWKVVELNNPSVEYFLRRAYGLIL